MKMAVISNTFYGYVNNYSLSYPELAYVKILQVRRMGLTYTDSGVLAPNDFEFRYTDYLGKIEFNTNSTFEIPFNSPVDAEKILILYKT